MNPLRNPRIRTIVIFIGASTLILLAIAGAYVFIVPAALISSNLANSFHGSERESHLRVLEETAEAEIDNEASFWLNSGGWALIDGDHIKTIEGTIPSVSYWRLRYRLSNPLDTDNGYRPQNIFRLVTTSSIKNAEETLYARILTINRSESPNRNESNGILLMSRYKDGDNLYYAGIRVDGYAVIKRKQNGRYETLALAPLWNLPEHPYHRTLQPNLIPEQTWIGLKLTTRDRADGSVELNFYIDTNGTWELAVSARDPRPLPPSTTAHGGVRSDFMDAEFRSYTLQEWEGGDLTPPPTHTEPSENVPAAES